MLKEILQFLEKDAGQRMLEVLKKPVQLLRQNQGYATYTLTVNPGWGQLGTALGGGLSNATSGMWATTTSANTLQYQGFQA